MNRKNVGFGMRGSMLILYQAIAFYLFTVFNLSLIHISSQRVSATYRRTRGSAFLYRCPVLWPAQIFPSHHPVLSLIHICCESGIDL